MFTINNTIWKLKFVDPYDCNLMRSDGTYTIGVTDASNYTIYINNQLSDEMTKKCLTHELAHAYMISYDVYIPIIIEEYICQSISEIGDEIISLSECIYGNLKKYYGEEL